MTNLNEQIRHRIVERAQKDIYDQDKFKLAEDELARAVWDAAFTDEQKAAMKLLPESMMNWARSLSVRAEGMSFQLTLKGGVYDGNKHWDHLLPVPGYEPLTVKGKLSKEVVDYSRHRDAVLEKAHQVGKQLMERLRKLRTFKQLREAWPEGEVYYNDLETTPARAVMIPFTTINETLGLPKDKAA